MRGEIFLTQSVLDAGRIDCTEEAAPNFSPVATPLKDTLRI